MKVLSVIAIIHKKLTLNNKTKKIIKLQKHEKIIHICLDQHIQFYQLKLKIRQLCLKKIKISKTKIKIILQLNLVIKIYKLCKKIIIII